MLISIKFDSKLFFLFNNKNYHITKMNCFHCQKNISGKPWLHLENILCLDEEKKESYQDKYICGYICFCRLHERNKFPKNLWNHTVNKEDYKGLIRPVSSYSQKFRYLNTSEINKLSNHQKCIYYQKEQEHIDNNPLSYEVYKESLYEDNRTQMIEEMISDESYDDY